MATEIKAIDQKAKFHYKDGGVIKDTINIRSCLLIDFKSLRDFYDILACPEKTS